MVDVSAVAGFDFADDGRALAQVDWDRDGRLDVWTVNRSAPRARFLRNQSAADNHFVSFQLNGNMGNRDAIGARVVLKLADGTELTETLTAGQGYLSQSSKWVHFGLGKRTEIDGVKVYWPVKDLSPEIFRDLQADQHYTLRQGSDSAITKTSISTARLMKRPHWNRRG